MKRKTYINSKTGDFTKNATLAMIWHKQGDIVQVNTIDEKGTTCDVTHINGKPQKQKDENREQCKRIADTVEAYADGRIYKCPECGEELEMPDGVGDKFKCPCCHAVADTDEWDQCGLYDYFSNILDIDYLVNYKKEYKACRILIAFGGPNIYIDTLSGYVELYWWTDTAKYRIAHDTITAIDEWANEYFDCM